MLMCRLGSHLAKCITRARSRTTRELERLVLAQDTRHLFQDEHNTNYSQ